MTMRRVIWTALALGRRQWEIPKIAVTMRPPPGNSLAIHDDFIALARPRRVPGVNTADALKKLAVVLNLIFRAERARVWPRCIRGSRRLRWALQYDISKVVVGRRPWSLGTHTHFGKLLF